MTPALLMSVSSAGNCASTLPYRVAIAAGSLTSLLKVWMPGSACLAIELFLVATSDENRVAPLKKLLRQFKADTARATGYENGLFFQFHFRLLCVWLIFACLLES